MENNPFQDKVVKVKKLGKNALLQVSKNDHSNRIFVDFSSVDGRIKVQKSFQDNFEGRKEAKEFEKRFKSLEEIKKYLGII